MVVAPAAASLRPVATATWLMMAGNAAVWGLLVGEPTVVIGCTVAAVGSALVVLVSHRTTAAVSPAIINQPPNTET